MRDGDHIAQYRSIVHLHVFSNNICCKEKFIKTISMIKDPQSKVMHPFIHVNHLNGLRCAQYYTLHLCNTIMCTNSYEKFMCRIGNLFPIPIVVLMVPMTRRIQMDLSLMLS